MYNLTIGPNGKMLGMEKTILVLARNAIILN